MSEILPLTTSTIRLPEDAPIKRLPRQPQRVRDEKFISRFDATTLYYDAFWHHEKQDVLMVGPAPTNLKSHYKNATYKALPSGKRLVVKHYFSLSVMTTQVQNVPKDTVAIEMCFAGEHFDIEVQPSFCDMLAGENILFTLSKNNDVKWIRFWADYHVRHHKTSTIILFDNGSDAYGISVLEDTLRSVEGLKKIIIHSMPFPYCAKDEAVKVNPYWAHFLQIGLMSITLRRFGMRANAILNMDIDELANSNGAGSVFDLAKASPLGLLAMKGVWVEPIVDHDAQRYGDHSDFCVVSKDPKLNYCYAGKWALDPSRTWVQKLKVFPYMHWIENRAQLGRRYIKNVYFWHFKGINTNWKLKRAQTIAFDVNQHEKRDICF